jgi:hypothetical protein
MLRALLILLAMILCTTTVALAQSTLELRPYVGQLRTIDVTVAGRPARMIFDTGAGLTSVTPEFAAEIGCAPFGNITGFRMNGERVSFQRCPEANLTAGAFGVRTELGVFDLGAVLPEGLPHVDGVMGLDVFRGSAITLEGLERLRIESRASLRRTTRGVEPARMRPLSDLSGSLTAFVPVATPLGDAWLLLDSANLDGVRLHPWTYEAMLPGGQSRDEVASVALSVEGAESVTIAPRVDPALIYDGAVDARFMRDYTITIDLARERIWWRRRSD